VHFEAAEQSGLAQRAIVSKKQQRFPLMFDHSQHAEAVQSPPDLNHQQLTRNTLIPMERLEGSWLVQHPPDDYRRIEVDCVESVHLS
jgi:hypothetical protein